MRLTNEMLKQAPVGALVCYYSGLTGFTSIVRYDGRGWHEMTGVYAGTRWTLDQLMDLRLGGYIYHLCDPLVKRRVSPQLEEYYEKNDSR